MLEPAGEASRTLESFFGEENLREIERICSGHMQRLVCEPIAADSGP